MRCRRTARRSRGGVGDARGLGGTALALALALAAAAGAETDPAAAADDAAPVAGWVLTRLDAGARAEGAYGVVRALEAALLEDPSLAADPDRAGALARACGERLGALPDSEPAHRAAVLVVVTAFAPREQRAAVNAAVVAALVETDPSRPPPGGAGLALGGFRLFPALGVGALYDDNVFSTRRGAVDDIVTLVSPSLEARSEWKRHWLALGGGADLAFYADQTEEDYQDYAFHADGRYDLLAATDLFGGASFSQGHEDRGSPDDVFGTRPTVFRDAFGYLGASQRFGRVSLRLGGTAQYLDFDDVPSLAGTIDNDDRDRRVYTGGLRAGVAVTRWATLFAEGAADIRRYEHVPDDAGFDRDSDGARAQGGVALRWRDLLRLEVRGGWLVQDYEDPQLPTVSVPLYGGRLEWTPSPFTSLALFVDRTLEETTLPGASAYLSTVYGATIDQEVLARLTFYGTASFQDVDYRGIDRDDDFVYLRAALRYHVTPWIYLQPEYRFVHRNSTDDFDDYSRNQVLLTVGAEMPDPAARRTRAIPPIRMRAPDAEADPFDFGGLYAGLQVGWGGRFADLTGPRRMGTDVLAAQFADQGVTAGLFGGYGFTWRRFLLGLEAEGELASAEWSHDSGTTGRVFEVAKKDAWGGGVRLGYAPRGSSLLYLRVAGMRARFRTRYVRGAPVEETDTEWGLRFGGGVEVPASQSVFLRLDYTYTGYEPYTITYSSSAGDVFEPAETLFRVGLGVRLGALLGGDDGRPPPPPARISGAYVGAHGGYGVLSTVLEGPRAAGTERLRTVFGDGGPTWGLFAGYGHRFGPIYLGLEGDADVSVADWDHERGPVDRTFSVRKQLSWGASGRVGLALRRAALLYLRGGGVRTRFNTRYDLAPVFVDQDDRVWGLRFGGGAEVPLSDRVFARVEYTYTAYDGYVVNYQAAVDDFENRETLFRAGVGVRF